MSDKKDTFIIDAMPMPFVSPVFPSPLQGEEKKLDESIPGGRYMVNGVLVDCNGKEIKK